jgi:dienelactone hydrolase
VLRALALVAGVLMTVVPSAHAFPHVRGCVRADFAGIPAERCGPAAGARAVVVLHGCGGFSTFDHRLAAGLPRYGISTLYVDYFARTPPPGRRGFCGVWTRPVQLFSTWERIAALGAQSLRPRFAHVGAVGWSLGAGVALAAAEDRHAFDAVAAFSALASPLTLDRAAFLPPSIVLDGGRRDIVPPANARALYAAARGAHVAAALYVYSDGTHDWPGAQGTTGIARAAAFLVRHLR